MKSEDLLRFHNELTQFDPKEPIAVTWDYINGLTFRQVGHVASFSYMANYFFIKPKLRLGIITPTDYAELMQSLEKLVQDHSLHDHSMNSVIGNFEFKIYKLFQGTSGPQLAYHLRFVSITRYWISYLYLRLFSLNSRILLNSINEQVKRPNSTNSSNKS